MIRIGLVGFGMASRVFHAPLISSVDGLQLAAVVERNGREAEKIYPDVATYTSLGAMLSDKSLELIVIPTPNPTHAPLAHEALNFGRHVVVDKPVGINSAEIRELIQLAKSTNRLLVPFHNRRWDSDFRTVQKLLLEAGPENVYYFESTFDRWRPTPRLKMWKENGDQGGGNLLDLGTHLVDQAIALFGLPDSVSAEVRSERLHALTDDAFTVRLRYSGGARDGDLQVVLSANCLASLPRPRFTIRWRLGNFVKMGLDPQEVRLKDSGHGAESLGQPWGEEPAAAWGTMAKALRGPDGNSSPDFEISRVPSQPGDYRLFYSGVREAILGNAPPPASSIDALRGAQILELARESSRLRCEIPCAW